MASKQGQVNESTGKVESKKVKRAKQVAFPITVRDTKLKRGWNALVG